jgi:hypothetical protein
MKRKVVHGVVIKEVSMRTSSGNLSIAKSSQSRAVKKRKMINDE